MLERGSSAVECRTRNQGSPGPNPPLLPFQSLGIFILSTMPQFTQLYKRVPGYRQWWKCEQIVIARNCCVARMLPREAELVSEWTGLPGEEKCKALWAVQRTGYCAMYSFKTTAITVTLTTHRLSKDLRQSLYHLPEVEA